MASPYIDNGKILTKHIRFFEYVSRAYSAPKGKKTQEECEQVCKAKNDLPIRDEKIQDGLFHHPVTEGLPDMQVGLLFQR